MISAGKQVFAILSVLIFLNACTDSPKGKIKLASLSESSSDTIRAASTILQVNPDQQRTIAILYFRNESPDASLDWLQRGITDMLVTELSQSPYLNILPIKVAEDESNASINKSELFNHDMISLIVRENKAEILLGGRYFKHDDSLYIETNIVDLQRNRIVHRELTAGAGLEQIFSMVNDLSGRVKEVLQQQMDAKAGEELVLEKMTRSVEAYRCFSRGREQIDKMIFLEAEQCFEDAVRFDSTFASAYLQLINIKFNLGKREKIGDYLKTIHRYENRLSEIDKIFFELFETRWEYDFVTYRKLLKKAVRRYPSNIQLRMELGNLYRNDGNDEGSLEQYETVLLLDPNYKLVYNYLGYLYANRGDFEMAIKYIDKYRQFAGDEPNPFDSKGEILIMAGRLQEAIPQFKASLQKLPTFYNSALRLSEIYSELYDYKNARAYLDQAREAALENEGMYTFDLNQALISWRFGEMQETKKQFNNLFKKYPQNVYMLILATDFYYSIGDSVSALNLHRSFFDQLKQMQVKEGKNFQSEATFIDFAFRAKIPAKELIEFAQELDTTKINEFTQIRLDLLLARLNERSGQFDHARFIYAKNVDKLVDLLLNSKRLSWSSSWGFVAQAFGSDTTLNDAQSNIFIDKLHETAMQNKRKDLVSLAKLLQAEIFINSGMETGAKQKFTDIGSPLETDWFVIGPFSYKNKSGFNFAYTPESDTDIEKTIHENKRELKWKPANDGRIDGYVSLNKLFSQNTFTVAYGLLYVESPNQRNVQIRLGTDETCKLWLNDEQIWQRYDKSDVQFDRDILSVVLHKGINKILIKVTNSNLDWGFHLRITDFNGNGYKDLEFIPADQLKAAIANITPQTGSSSPAIADKINANPVP